MCNIDVIFLNIFSFALFFLFMYVYSCLFLIFGITICVCSLLFGMIICWGFGYTLYSPFTHILCSLHEWDPILVSELLIIREDCVVVPRWIYFPSGHCENPH